MSNFAGSCGFPSHGFIVAVAVWFVAGATPGALAGPEVDPGDATWHIGLNELWGTNDQGEGRNLDIYPVFENGEWVRAVATARQFNTSIHLFREADIDFDGEKFSGTLEAVITPDPWVPADGQPIDLVVSIEGELVLSDDGTQHWVRGSYEGTLGDEAVEGRLGGGVGETETGWDDSRWNFRLNPVPHYQEENPPMLDVNLGVADGEVHWGRAGITRRHNRDAPRTWYFDVDDLQLDGATVTGTFTLPNRVVDSAGDPAIERQVEFTGHRVQGLNGGEAHIVAYREGERVGEDRRYFGRGGAHRGGGREVDRDVLWRHDLDEAPWHVPTEDFTPPEPGEHPRLMFRRDDLDELRRRAETEEGQAILDRMRYQLNGGDGRSLPEKRNPERGFPDRDSPANSVSDADVGEAFTLFHPAGYGLLWQLTGDEHYAELGRESVELILEGQRDRDNRYSFRDPRGTLRAGVALSAMAMAYDLLYDSWDEDFRKEVTAAIEHYDERGDTLADLVHGGTYIPASNHWGMMVGGGAKALLAISGNPEVEDQDEIDHLLEASARMMVYKMDHAFGDLGFFPEGDGTGVMGNLINFLPALQAWKNAGGKDFFNAPRENTRWLVMRWVLLSMPRDGDRQPHFPNRGGYPHNIWARGMSGPGVFSWGFGALTDEKDKAALLWLYNRVEPYVGSYETNNPYPYRGVGSFINWPLELQQRNPAEALPRAAVDTLHGHFVHRNRWEDGSDILVTAFLHSGHQGYIGIDDRHHMQVWGLGQRMTWRTNLINTAPVHYATEDDGSGTFTVRGGGDLSALAVDFSGASGAPLLLVGYGPAFPADRFSETGDTEGANARAVEVDAGGHTYAIVTLQRGEAPEVSAEGEGDDAVVRIGDQTIRFDGEKLVLEPIE